VMSFSLPFKSFSEESLEEDGFGSRSVGRGWECQRLPGREKKEEYTKLVDLQIIENISNR